MTYQNQIIDESPFLPMTPILVEEKNETKVGQNIMKSINYEGEEGFFLSLKEHKQIQDFLISAEKVVVQDADNS